MKFGAEYEEALKKEEYPSQWIDSAISYKKLKKCIKRVREELLSLGLDNETLEALWQHVGTHNVSDIGELDTERMLHYEFVSEEGARFVPKLTVALDPKDGSPMDAWLSPETRRVLQKVGKHRQRRLSRRQSVAPSNITEGNTFDAVNGITNSSNTGSLDTSPDRGSNVTDQDVSQVLNGDAQKSTEDEEEVVETIEIPLTSDSEFFQILRKELKALERLQLAEQKDISSSIEDLSKDLQVLKSSKSKFARAELSTWREIFRLYIESDIFMSSHEQDAGVRDPQKAAERLRSFAKQLSDVKTNPLKPKSKEAHIALERFLNINTTLLRLLKFQELNRKALGKILKKFDKKTSLHALSSTTKSKMINLFNTNPNTAVVSPKDLARSTAFAISQSLLSLIPQLDDYLCPICSYISYKPIRLRCNHVFCIRCMIRMQRDSKDECPLCRERVIQEATDFNLDFDLKKFLKTEFPEEVEEKKKENDLEAGREIWGDDYKGTTKCAVM